MNKKNIFGILMIPFILLPITTYAFWNICVPVSATLLVFVLGWPQIIIYSLFKYQISENLLDNNFILFGVVANLILAYVFGLVIDVWRKKGGYISKKYYFKIPLLVLVAILILLCLLFVDKSCFPA